MHAYLQETVERLTAHFAAQPWCVGVYLAGSGGAGTDDAWSDVDLDVVVEDGIYDEVVAGLRPLCERECGHIQVWLPEGERPGAFCNYAFLFEHAGEQFLYDLAVQTQSDLLAAARRRPGAILHDPQGLLSRLKEERQPAAYRPAEGPRSGHLAYVIDQYWVYAYLCGKYWRRQDRYKLLYVLQVLFSAHLRLLRALHPNGEWGWWPRDIKRLPEETRTALLGYFTPADLTAARGALVQSLDAFGRDARAACARWALSYPEATEDYVRRHLADAGLLSSASHD